MMSQRMRQEGRFTRFLFLFCTVVLLVPCPAAASEFVPVVTEVEPFSSAGTVLTGNLTSFTGLPTAYLIGHDYDYSFTGPLHLDIGAFVGFDEDLFLLRLIPGVKYKLVLPRLTFVPYAKASLAADISFGDAAGGNTLGIGLRLAGGVRHFFTRNLGMGAEVGITFGTAAGGDEASASFAAEGLVAFEYLLP